MWNYSLVNSGDDYLAHHGILGMKWGERRYQYEDGTLTPAGKERYGKKTYGQDPLRPAEKKKTYGQDPLRPAEKKKKKISDMSDEELLADNKRRALETQYKKNHPEPKSTLQVGKESVDSAQKMVQQLNDLNRMVSNKHKKNTQDLSKMSDDDLRKTINRKNLERQYRDLIYEPDAVDRGRAKVDEILSYGGAVLGITSSALSIAIAINQLKKKN